MVSKEKVSRRENPFTGENVTDTRTAREANVDPSIREEKTAPTPTRKEQNTEYCLLCQNLILNATPETKCQKCGYSRRDVKERMFSKYHASGKM